MGGRFQISNHQFGIGRRLRDGRSNEPANHWPSHSRPHPPRLPGDDNGNYTLGDQDNLTNFAGGTLGDEREKAQP